MSELTDKFGMSRVTGKKSWIVFGALFATMFIDQYILNIPFANVVFPVLALSAVLLSAYQAVLLAVSYGIVFELYGCFGYYGPTTVVPWTVEVVIGFSFTVLLVLLNRQQVSVLSLTKAAVLGELLYYWTSVVATVLIWKVPPVSYFLSDLPYELMGCLATGLCALAVFLPIQIISSIDYDRYQELKLHVCNQFIAYLA